MKRISTTGEAAKDSSVITAMLRNRDKKKIIKTGQTYSWREQMPQVGVLEKHQRGFERQKK